MWSAVAFPLLPPACSSVILASSLALLCIILSNSLRTLLVNVIPLSVGGCLPFHLFWSKCDEM